MLRIHEGASTFTDDMGRGVVVVESDCGGPNFAPAFDELQATQARSLAQQYAASRGMATPRLNGSPTGPYPVNHQGKSLEHVKDASDQPLPPDHVDMQPARYRLDVPVCAPLL